MKTEQKTLSSCQRGKKDRQNDSNLENFNSFSGNPQKGSRKQVKPYKIHFRDFPSDTNLDRVCVQGRILAKVDMYWSCDDICKKPPKDSKKCRNCIINAFKDWYTGSGEDFLVSLDLEVLPIEEASNK